MYIYLYYDDIIHDYLYNISEHKNPNLGILIKKIGIDSFDWLMFIYKYVKNYKYT